MKGLIPPSISWVGFVGFNALSEHKLSRGDEFIFVNFIGENVD